MKLSFAKMHYKTVLFIGFFIIAFTFSCKKEKSLIISGELSNAYAGNLYLSEFKLVSNKIIDSVDVKSNGKFKFKVKIKEPSFFQIKTSESNFIILLAEPGERIKIAADMQKMNFNYIVSGSERSQEVKLLTDQLNYTKAALDSLSKVAGQNAKKPGYEKILMSLDSQYVEIIKAQRRFSIKFMLDHITSMSSIVALYQQIDENNYVLNQNRDLQYIKIISDSLSKYYPNSDVVKILYKDRSRLLSDFNRLKFEIAASNVPVSKFPDIVLKTTSNDTLKLSKLKNKLILLNFWAPENEESLVVMKSLIEIYNKHHKKGLEIYNVGLMRDFEKWKEVVEKFKFPGLQVIDQDVERSYSLRVYNVKKLPANVLINESGIVNTNIFGESLENKISQLLR